jgi:hypothetical protein
MAKKRLPGKQWKPKIRRTMQAGTLQFKFELDKASVAQLDGFSQRFQKALKQVIKDVVKEEVLPYLEANFYDASWPEHSPIFTTASGDMYNTFYMQGANYDEGFEDFWNTISDFDAYASNDGAGFQLAPNAEYLLFDNYTAFSGITGSTKKDSWFLGVERGTGVGENTGGNIFDGTTKYGPPEGSWWFGPKSKPKTGPQFLGQKGFNLFWSPESTRRPQPFWKKLLREKLPGRLQTDLVAYLKGKSI